MSQRAESEEWLDNLWSEVEDIVNAIKEYLESHADEPPSVIGDISIAAVVSEADDKASQNSESSVGLHEVDAALKFTKLLSKSTQSKEKKSALISNNEDSDSDEKDTKEDDEDEEQFDSKGFDKMFKGIKKPTLTVLSEDKDLYHDLKAQFEIFLDQMKVPGKTKMMMLKNSLSGRPLRVVERLGYTSRQYQTALEKLDLKYGGEK